MTLNRMTLLSMTFCWMTFSRKVPFILMLSTMDCFATVMLGVKVLIGHIVLFSVNLHNVILQSVNMLNVVVSYFLDLK